MARRCSTVCLPFDQTTYPGVAADPAASRAVPALFPRSPGVPFWALAFVFGKGHGCWYRLQVSLGRSSVAGTTPREAGVPEHLLADEHHRPRHGQEVENDSRIPHVMSTRPTRKSVSGPAKHGATPGPGTPSRGSQRRVRGDGGIEAGSPDFASRRTRSAPPCRLR